METKNTAVVLSERALAIRLTFARWECGLVADTDQWYQEAARLGGDHPHASLPDSFVDVPDLACAFIFGQDEALADIGMKELFQDARDSSGRGKECGKPMGPEPSAVEVVAYPNLLAWNCSVRRYPEEPQPSVLRQGFEFHGGRSALRARKERPGPAPSADVEDVSD